MDMGFEGQSPHNEIQVVLVIVPVCDQGFQAKGLSQASIVS